MTRLHVEVLPLDRASSRKAMRTVRALRRDDFSRGKSALLNEVPGSIVLSLVLVARDSFFASQAFVFFGIANDAAATGIVRCSLKRLASPDQCTLTRAAGGLALAGVAVAYVLYGER